MYGGANVFPAYFEHIHPIYPFLDQVSFEERVSSPDAHASESTQKTWLVLYHAVLSLGCMYHNGGSFQPAHGLAWNYFRTSVSHFQDLLLCKASLLKAQVRFGPRNEHHISNFVGDDSNGEVPS